MREHKDFIWKTTFGSLQIEVKEDSHADDTLRIEIRLPTREKVNLHWGLTRNKNGKWHIPPHSLWPQKPIIFHNQDAVQTPFALDSDESKGSFIEIFWPSKGLHKDISFVLYYPDKKEWINNSGENYFIPLHHICQKYNEQKRTLKKIIPPARAVKKKEPHIPLKIRTEILQEHSNWIITLSAKTKDPVILHWGVYFPSTSGWLIPEKSLWPKKSKIFKEGMAVRTPFSIDDDNATVLFCIPTSSGIKRLDYVLFFPVTKVWQNNEGHNYHIFLNENKDIPSPRFIGISEAIKKIIDAEVSDHSWSLMHRFNLCTDILVHEKHNKNKELLILLNIYLRYSSLRQLTWQRNFNTKPRELSWSIRCLAEESVKYANSHQELIPYTRMLLSNLSMGGDGQRIRDEILNIMHRHKIGEVYGTFLEQWHQKLHNNTTKDDIAICEAYLAFLRSDGDTEVFYHTLKINGITHDRLHSFERPITSDPQFFPDKTDDMIPDFEHFLKILKEVHEGTDLKVAIENAQHDLHDPELIENLSEILFAREELGHETNPDFLLERMELINRCRVKIYQKINQDKTETVARFYLLDWALEDSFRLMAERLIVYVEEDHFYIYLLHLVVKILASFLLITLIPFNSAPFQEYISRLISFPKNNYDWFIQTKAAIDQISLLIGEAIQEIIDTFQLLAEYLGDYLGIAQFFIELFSEEIIRSSSLFSLSKCIAKLQILIRRLAHLGDWQIISPSKGLGVSGTLLHVAHMHNIINDSGISQKIILTDTIEGDENIPSDSVAILSPDDTDIVSHIAVRARNNGILFATCYNNELFEQLCALEGKEVSLTIDSTRAIIWEPTKLTKSSQKKTIISLPHIDPTFTQFCLSGNEFTPTRVGPKSYNIKEIENELQDMAAFAPAIAIPFGVYEHLLRERENREIELLIKDHEKSILTEQKMGRIIFMLQEIQRAIACLTIKQEYIALLKHFMKKYLEFDLDDNEAACNAIKTVWASKWNKAAFLSRKELGIASGNMYMSVLIEPIIPGEYSFVIHTANPTTRDENEIYIEVVKGMGDTLVDNLAGRSFAFSFDKRSKNIKIVSFLSKLYASYNTGLIFRSDSNAEDLPFYAGAGLYTTTPLWPKRMEKINLNNDPLSWDEHFRREFITSIAEVAIKIAHIKGAHQDIEGTYFNNRIYILQSRNQML
ncbi:MAG: phosphohistidine-like domain-containing protein [bacterium]